MESVMKRTTATGFLSTCAISLALFSSCTSVEPNTLTPEEIADGWQLLFDGKNIKRLERLQRNNPDTTLACG